MASLFNEVCSVGEALNRERADTRKEAYRGAGEGAAFFGVLNSFARQQAATWTGGSGGLFCR